MYFGNKEQQKYQKQLSLRVISLESYDLGITIETIV